MPLIWPVFLFLSCLFLHTVYRLYLYSFYSAYISVYSHASFCTIWVEVAWTSESLLPYHTTQETLTCTLKLFTVLTASY